MYLRKQPGVDLLYIGRHSDNKHAGLLDAIEISTDTFRMYFNIKCMSIIFSEIMGLSDVTWHTLLSIVNVN